MMHVSDPVTHAFEAKLRAGTIKDDAAQRAVLPALDAAVARLGAAPKSTSGSGGLIRRLFGAPPPAAAAPRGLYLWGGVGRGKSMLMDLVYEVAPTEAKRRVHFHAFMQEVQAGLNAARAVGAQDAVRPVAEGIAVTTRLLCFDEMQISDIADAMIVGRLFQVLFEKDVMVITTSNRVPDDLYKDGLNRNLFLPFIAMIHEHMDVVHLQSQRDHRQGRLMGERVWFAPLGAPARREMDAAWDELTDCAAPSAMELPVGGRTVLIPQYHGRVGRARFEDLCGKPLGPADYLAIAEALDVLLIDDIPELGPLNHDRARRFVTLIDAAYEARLRVIASAAAEPEALYPRGEGSFEFERTASRLREMQDADWGRKG